MMRWLPVMQAARRSLWLLVCAWSLGAGLILGGSYFSNYLDENNLQLINQNAVQKNDLLRRTEDLTYLEQQIETFRAIAQHGMLGMPERENWGQQVLASRQRLGLPESLTYIVKAPVAIGDQTSLGMPPPAAAGEEREMNLPLIHDLEIDLRDTHEDELLGLLSDLQANIREPFRVQSCRFLAPAETGVNIQCTLRFFSFPALTAQERQGLEAASSENATPLKGIAAAAMGKANEIVAEPLPNLFFTPDQRKAIVEARRGNVEAAVKTFTLGGVVRREGRRGTIWINGEAFAEGQSIGAMSAPRIESDSVRIEGRSLRVGESLDLHSGQRKDLAPAGAIGIRNVVK